MIFNCIIKLSVWGRQYCGLQKPDETRNFHDFTFSVSFICRMRFVLVQAQQTKTELVTLRKFLYFLGTDAKKLNCYFGILDYTGSRAYLTF